MSLDDKVDHNRAVADIAIAETKAALKDWSGRPFSVLGRWMLVSFGIGCAMIVGTLLVATWSTPDPTPFRLGGGSVQQMGLVLFRNGLVLALHGFVCIAGFMAMRALPEQALLRTGFDRWIHENAGKAAMVWVTGATIFSITTQTWILGHLMADLAAGSHAPEWKVMLSVLPHALPELTAVFLPLAAFLLASRNKRWNELLAATVFTVAVAVPILIVAAAIEAYLWPQLVPSFGGGSFFTG